MGAEVPAARRAPGVSNPAGGGHRQPDRRIDQCAREMGRDHGSAPGGRACRRRRPRQARVERGRPGRQPLFDRASQLRVVFPHAVGPRSTCTRAVGGCGCRRSRGDHGHPRRPFVHRARRARVAAIVRIQRIESARLRRGGRSARCRRPGHPAGTQQRAGGVGNRRLAGQPRPDQQKRRARLHVDRASGAGCLPNRHPNARSAAPANVDGQQPDLRARARGPAASCPAAGNGDTPPDREQTGRYLAVRGRPDVAGGTRCGAHTDGYPS